MDRIRFVSPKDRAAWFALWDTLERSPLGVDRVSRCPETGEIWQYMGTIEGNHEFRHRHHPKTKQREVFSTKA